MTIAEFLSTFAVLWAGMFILFLVGYGLYSLSKQDRPPRLPPATILKHRRDAHKALNEAIERENVELIDMKGFGHD